MTTLVRLCRSLTDRRLRPHRVTLRHARADVPREVGKHFGCRVVFGGSADEIVFSKAIERTPVSGADPFLNELLRKYCDEARSLRRIKSSSLRADIENAIVPLLPHKRVRLSEIAEALALGRRTISRRLMHEGLTFSRILNDLRRDLARRYLHESGLPISSIAWLLGYHDVSSFTHASRRWLGRSPKQARAAALCGSATK
jgi:AraC-like DNA-binding protein